MIRIVEATALEAELLSALYEAGLGEPWAVADLARVLAAPGVVALMACAGSGDPVGLALARSAADEMEILSLAVLPDARRRGAGTALLGAVIDRAGRAGARAIHLEVAATNAAALALYRRFGFRATGRRRDYYRIAGTTVDAITMRRDRGAW